jgi:hypothetical protein
MFGIWAAAETEKTYNAVSIAVYLYYLSDPKIAKNLQRCKYRRLFVLS